MREYSKQQKLSISNTDKSRKKNSLVTAKICVLNGCAHMAKGRWQKFKSAVFHWHVIAKRNLSFISQSEVG